MREWENNTEQFDQFTKLCERYAQEGLAQVVIHLELSPEDKATFTELAEAYHVNAEAECISGKISDQERKGRVIAYHIMRNSLHCC